MRLVFLKFILQAQQSDLQHDKIHAQMQTTPGNGEQLHWPSDPGTSAAVSDHKCVA